MTQATTIRGKESALFVAIIRNKTSEVKKLIAEGVSANTVDDHGRPALFQAAAYGSIGAIEALLDAGAPINRRCADKHVTALNGAIANYKTAAASLLLDRGADPRITNDSHCTPAHILVRSLKDLLNPARVPTTSPEDALNLFSKLLAKGNPPDYIAGDGRSLLDDLVFRQAPEVMGKGAPIPFVRTLLNRLALAGKFDGRVPLCTWRSDNLNALRLIVAHGGDINTTDRYGLSLIRYADDVATIDEMVHLGANINHLDHNGQNVLANYIDNDTPGEDKLPRLVCLVQHGIDVDQTDLGGESVTSRLAQRSDPVSIQLKIIIGAYKARQVMANAARRRIAAANSA